MTVLVRAGMRPSRRTMDILIGLPAHAGSSGIRHSARKLSQCQ